MKLTIEKDYDAMSLRAAGYVTELVKIKPEALICIAAGDTPKLTCDLIAQTAKKEKIDFSRTYFVSLDEWVGIPPSNEGSCQYFLRTYLFDHLNINKKNIHLFNALEKDMQSECKRMDEFIKQHGGIDLMIVGVGKNGHIGFNEPGVPFNAYSHIVELDETTKTVGQKYFREETKLSRGITLGLQHLLESRKVILIANGFKKAEVMKRAIEEEISNEMPAGIMRLHPDGEIILDKDAASLLSQQT
jgi:glucosamine-6-phosphate deaminase